MLLYLLAEVTNQDGTFQAIVAPLLELQVQKTRQNVPSTYSSLHTLQMGVCFTPPHQVQLRPRIPINVINNPLNKKKS